MPGAAVAGLGRAVLAAGLAALAGAPSLVRAGGDGPAAAPRRRLPEVVVGATALDEVEDDPTAFASVIRLDEHAGEAPRVDELLEHAVGVQVRRFGGPGERAEVSIRGSAPSQVVVRLDGVRLNSAQSGAVDLSTIPIELLERIDVTRGGGSAQVGSDAIGGVIDLATRRPGGPSRTRATISAGSFGTGEASVSSAGIADAWEYSVGYQGFVTDGDYRFQRPAVRVGGVSIVPDPDEVERINNRAEQHAALVRVGRAFGSHAYASLLDYGVVTSRGQPGLDAGTGETAGQQRKAHERVTRNLASLRLEVTPPRWPGGRGELGAFHRIERSAFHDSEPSLGGGLADELDTRHENEAFGSHAAAVIESHHGPLSQRSEWRLDLRLDTLDSNELEDQERGTLGAFVQQELGLFEERLRLVPALRFDRTRGFGGRWIPRVGAIWRALPGLRAKANWERSFRIPSLDELFFPDQGFLRGNPDLAPEEATNVDAGIEVALARLGPWRDLRLQGAWFRHRIRESVVFALVSPFTVAPINTGRADERGFELSLRAGLGAWITLEANGTWLRARLAGSGTRLPGRPDRELSARARIAPPSGAFRLVAEIQETDRIPVSRAGNVFLPSRTVVDASASFDLARVGPVAGRISLRELWLVLEGENLGDRSVRDARFFPQPGRRVGVRLEGAW